MQKTADVVIIGGGIMGASTAYHLARAGCRNIQVLEKQELCGMGATGQNAGGVRHQFSTPVNIELSCHSIEKLKRFPEEMGQEIDLLCCGYLFLIDNADDLEAFTKAATLHESYGLSTQMLDPTEIAEIAPQVRLDGILAGSFNAQDGLVDPSSVLQGYLRQAQHLGVRIETDTTVTGLQVEGTRIVALQTSQGRIATECVVMAAGPWSGELARCCGLTLPVVPVRRQMAVTTPIAEIDKSFPFVIDFSQALYFHYEGGGILTGMSNPDQRPGFDISIDEEWKLVHLARAIERLPVLENARLMAEWAGLYEVTPDHQPIMGKLSHFEGLFACTGFSGHGFMHGPIAGQLLAEEILQGQATTVNIDPLRYERFQGLRTAAERTVI